MTTVTFLDLPALVAQLKRHEGVRLNTYTDTTGHVTIGVGRNLSDRGISMQEAEALLMNDIAATIGELSVRLRWFDRLDPVRQRALIDLAFNIGVAGLLKFPRMLAALQEGIVTGSFALARAELLASRWAHQVQPERRDRLASMIGTGTDHTP